MKKAKEYAEEFNADPTSDTLLEIARMFLLEVKQIGESRNIRSNEALFSVLDEQDRKWKAFARHVGPGIIRPDGFEGLVAEHFPKVYIYWRGLGRQERSERR